MNWKQAIKYMKKGGKVTRKHWLKNDYLFMKPNENVIYCDGGFTYVQLLVELKKNISALKRSIWIKSYAV